MKDLESRIKSAPVVAPSANLNRRMEAVFAAARHAHADSRRGILWRALTAAATAGIIATLFLALPGRLPTAPGPAVYEIEAEGRMREMLLNARATRDVPMQFVVRIQSP